MTKISHAIAAMLMVFASQAVASEPRTQAAAKEAAVTNSSPAQAADNRGATEYSNTFTCIPASTPYSGGIMVGMGDGSVR